ncbi:MAG: DNA polymerase III subunit gamma/tau [Sphingobacteriales bacterium]|nr:MAG: DNA polymerase III subunit gamma/tau [Sphingobacteriales bacterium]
MSFVVSARKYRPQLFGDVVGQKSVTTTLKNAIKAGKLAHSFLFCGPRGVGKTTCARILAKLLNCQNPTAEAEPCGTCPSCTAFSQSASFNIFELDAASNNSVDDIRNLIEQVRFAPQSGKYKIYIIDEVHMLSSAAFNAFLKTLEEPPSYAIFILATTEKHKIIPTILSRCQIYDFNRISVQDMVEHLLEISKDQQIVAEVDALHIIAQKADGGLRDALSMFDRIASYSEGKIGYEQVLEALNVLDYDYFFKATDYLLIQDAAGLLMLFDEILRKGFEGDNFINGLAAHFRNLLVCKDEATLSLLDVTEGLKDRYRTQAQLAPMSLLLSALNLANECEIQYRTSKNKRLQVELFLLKMCYAANAVQLSNYQGSGNVALQANNGEISLILKTPVEFTKKEKQEPKTNESAKDKPAVLYNENDPVRTVKENTENYVTTGTVKFSMGQLHNTKLETPAKTDEREPVKDAKTDVSLTEKEQKAYTQDQGDEATMLNCWQEYSQKIELGSVRTLFEQITPLLQGFSILICVSSEVQKELMKEDAPKFLRYLQKKTGSRQYSIDWQINKPTSDDSQKTLPAYTPNEQLKEMLLDNPAISELIKRLQLQLN